jgi:magnesium transporter
MHVRTFDGRGFHTVDQPDWSVLLNSKDEMVLWVDLSAPNIDDLMRLEQVFKFHPLAIEDAATKFQRPKIESYSDHLFMILNSVHLMKDDLVFTEVDMFIGANYLVTVHSGQEMLINEVARRCAPASILASRWAIWSMS